MTVTLYNDDCMNIMRGMDDNIIDLTVTSPPYDNLRTYNGEIDEKKYNGYSFDFESIARELYRITKIGGVVVWVVNDATVNGSETGTSFRQALYFKEIGFSLHDTMIYCKDSLNMPISNRYYQVFEYMFVLCKTKLNTSNLLQEKTIHRGDNKTSSTRLPDGNTRKHKYETGKSTRNKGNVWFYGVGYMKSTADVFAYAHPAMFPEALARDHIFSWSNSGDIVFDCFLGSGTTGKMAVMYERNFIGIEKDPSYFAIAERRIHDAQQHQPLPGMFT